MLRNVSLGREFSFFVPSRMKSCAPIKFVCTIRYSWKETFVLINMSSGSGKSICYALLLWASQEKVRNVQAWFFRVVVNIKPLWDWTSSVGLASNHPGLSVQGGNIVKTIWSCPGFVEQKPC